MSKTIDIVFDGPPGHESGRFVEVERDGRSISIGEWIQRDDGMWVLRIPDPQTPSCGISEAIEAMRNGCLVARKGWNGKGMHLRLIEPPPPPVGLPKSLPYVEMTTAQGDLVPWLASQTDLLASDWEIVAKPQA